MACDREFGAVSVCRGSWMPSYDSGTERCIDQNGHVEKRHPSTNDIVES
jgi:hypothetical protein